MAVEDSKITLLDWLDGEIDVAKGPDGQRVKTTIIKYFCELVAVNGGSLNVTRYGPVKQGVGLYGRMGLTLQEAMALINFSGIFTGFVMAQGDVMGAAARIKMQQEIERVRAEGFEDATPNVGIYTESDLKMLHNPQKKVKLKLNL